jgi:hypothetical protein
VTTPLKIDNAPLLHMPVKVKPYAHQIAAFNFACKLFGLTEGGDVRSISSRGIAYLMEMG